MTFQREQDAQFIWSDSTGEGRNVFNRFHLQLDLTETATTAPINLFADTRYRLLVNGDFIGSGPARFHPTHPEYDRYDIATHLHPGINQIVVEVVSYGASSYQTTRQSAGGFIAWGEILSGGQALSLATPGNWTVQPGVAWLKSSPTFSFAQGPCEILDTRKDGDGAPKTPTLIENQSRWGALGERSVAYSTLEKLDPDLLLNVFDIINEETLIGFNQHDLHYVTNLESKPRTVYATCIHSPSAQEVPIGTFWGDSFLNGTPLEPQNDSVRGNRQNVTLSLNEGWNLLFGDTEQLEEIWGFFLGIPKTYGLTVRATANKDDSDVMRFSDPILPKDRDAIIPSIPATPAELAELTLSWNAIPVADSAPQNPARIRAWDCIKNSADGDQPLSEGVRTWVYEFKAEFDGYPYVEVEAPAGTLLDIGVDDWINDRGLLDIYGSNPFVNSVDRYILKGGSQKIQSFHVRGGHYLQVTLTLPDGATESATLNDVKIVSANSPMPAEGSFECSDPLFNWIWETSARTLQVSVEDSYADCPWRERGTYMGDGFVNVHMHVALNRDWRIMPRMLRQFSDSQYANGQMPSAAPSWMVHAHEDFTLIWIKVLRDYYRFSLDLDFLREMWPTLERILASSAWEKEDNGLLNGTDNMQVFIDWGILASERSGNSSAALNAFWIDSIDCAAELAAALGNETRSKELQTESAQLRAAVSGTLWMPEEKRYAASLNEDGSFADTPAIHANILALLYRIGTDKQLEQVLTYMEAHLATNMERMSSMEGGQIELYFFFYTLQALYQNGRIEYAENLVRENYTVMMERDPGTLWEGIHCGLINKFSRCHSWGGGPMIYGSRYILGVQFPNPSDPNEVQIEPMAETIDWAKGVYPHPLGDIIVSWKRVEGVIELDYTVPEGITVVD